MARRYQNLSSDQIMREQRAERRAGEQVAQTRAAFEGATITNVEIAGASADKEGIVYGDQLVLTLSNGNLIALRPHRWFLDWTVEIQVAQSIEMLKRQLAANE